MRYKLVTENILRHLGVSKSYVGYDYVMYGIKLIMCDERYLNGITKVLYIDIAKEFNTTQSCVERNIRKIIEVIWKYAEENRMLISKIFGTRYSNQKPSNKEFLELLYDYVKSQDLFKRLQLENNITCPISNEVCDACVEIIEKLLNLN